jgi:hypothetical protein
MFTQDQTCNNDQGNLVKSIQFEDKIKPTAKLSVPDTYASQCDTLLLDGSDSIPGLTNGTLEYKWKITGGDWWSGFDQYESYSANSTITVPAKAITKTGTMKVELTVKNAHGKTDNV